jgi:hypothetical protein
MIPVRSLLLALLVAALPLTAVGQPDAGSLGKLVYFEGSVDVKTSGGSWTPATIGQSLSPSDRLRTGAAATAEIEWKSGTKSTVGPESNQRVGPLFKQVASQSGETSGMMERFEKLFQGEGTSDEDVGGIRRAAVETDEHSGPGELYWKTFEEVSFAEAQSMLKEKKYAQAARHFHLFLQQNPAHAMAPKAKLGLGLCYLRLNNPAQARSALTALVEEHPDTPLAERGRTLLDRL